MQIEYSLFLFFLIINTGLLLAQLHRARVQRSCDREHVRFLNTPLGKGTRSFPALLGLAILHKRGTEVLVWLRFGASNDFAC